MPVHVGEIKSDVSVAGRNQLPLNAHQLDQLVAMVLKRLAEKQRNAKWSREATELSREASPPLAIGG